MFGEGIAKFGDNWFWLTWKERIVFKYNKNFDLIDTLVLPPEMKEGWGLTSDDTYLYATDGSEMLFTIDPASFTVVDVTPVFTIVDGV